MMTIVRILSIMHSGFKIDIARILTTFLHEVSLKLFPIFRGKTFNLKMNSQEGQRSFVPTEACTIEKSLVRRSVELGETKNKK